MSPDTLAVLILVAAAVGFPIWMKLMAPHEDRQAWFRELKALGLRLRDFALRRS